MSSLSGSSSVSAALERAVPMSAMRRKRIQCTTRAQAASALARLNRVNIPGSSMLLTAPNYCHKIVSGLSALRDAGSLCDYTLIAGGLQIQVHRAVLVASSDYFRAMLTGDMRESRETSVTLQGVSGAGLRAVVDFAYSGSLSVGLDSVEDILAAASHLQVRDVVQLCSEFLDQIISVDNCVDILNISELYALHETHSAAQSFILEHFELLSGTEELYRLTVPQLTSLLTENGLKVRTEYHLLEIVLRWIAHNPVERESHVATLIGQIRLPLLTGEELVEKASRVDLIRTNAECSRLLSEAKDYHIMKKKQPLLQSTLTQVRSDKPCLIMCHNENLECYELNTGRHQYLKDCCVKMYSPCIAVVDNFMYACGGKYDNNENNDIATARCFRYDPRFDSWIELSSMNEARKDFSMVVFAGALYAIAGQDETTVMYSVEKFSIQDNDWRLTPILPNATYGHAAAVVNNRIYVSGGQRFDGHSKSVMSFDPITDIWRDEPSLLTARSNHSMVEVGGRLFVIGGNIEDSYGFPVAVTSIEMFTPPLGLWTTCNTLVNVREAGTVVLADRVYIVGGINGAHYYSDSVQVYTPADDSMETLDKLTTRIHGRACCMLHIPQYIFDWGD